MRVLTAAIHLSAVRQLPAHSKGCVTRVAVCRHTFSPSRGCLSSQPAPATAHPLLLTDMGSVPGVLHLCFLQFSAHSSGPRCWGPFRAIQVMVGASVHSCSGCNLDNTTQYSQSLCSFDKAGAGSRGAAPGPCTVRPCPL